MLKTPLGVRAQTLVTGLRREAEAWLAFLAIRAKRAMQVEKLGLSQNLQRYGQGIAIEGVALLLAMLGVSLE